MRDDFSKLHPIVNIVFFMAVMMTAMFVMHPVFQVVSFCAASIYLLYLRRNKGIQVLLTMIPVFIITSLINPLFSHEGATLICYLPTGNPVTLESIVFGISSGLMIVTELMWFAVFNTIITGDKILCVTSKLMPAMGTLLSMIFRFVPKYMIQAKKVANANLAIEGKTNKKNSRERMRQGIKNFGIMLTWSLENSVVTADSMKARGYGSGRRTSFSMYEFKLRDAINMAIIVCLLLWNVVLIITGKIAYQYYPVIGFSKANGILEIVIYYGAQAILSLLPIIINIKEDLKWHRLQSKI